LYSCITMTAGRALCHGGAVDPVQHFSQQGFIQFLGIEPIGAGAGKATIRLSPKAEHLNHNDTVNAAVIYGLAEVAGAGAVVADMLDLAAESYTVVKHASIDYLAPGRGILEATGRTDVKALQQAKDQLVAGLPVQVEVPVTVTDCDGAEVATVQFTVAIRPRRTPQ
jgi:acyl-CoA thioesterase